MNQLTKERENILNKLTEQKSEKEQQINLISNLEIREVNETEWHILCDTPLRHNNLLLDIAKATFPYGENFNRDANNVIFTVNGFKVFVPTHKVKGLNIDMSWYKDSYNEEFVPRNNYKHMRKYFKLLESKSSWYELARSRCNKNYSKTRLFFWWFFGAKWSKVNKNYWNEQFLKEDNYNKEMLNKTKDFKEELKIKIENFHQTVDILKEWGEVKGYIRDNDIYTIKNVENYLR